MEQATTRRNVLRLLAGAAAAGAGGTVQPFAAKTALIGRLIEEARALPAVSQRIDFISRSLLGVRYQANTLIGGPKHPERFVVRDDAFDCVTFCEVVLAAAIARDLGEFETSLRRIRYDHGNVQWDQRNHYFADWSQRNIENQDLPAGRDRAVGHHRQDRHLASRARQAPRVDRGHSARRRCWTTPSCCRRATSSASPRGDRISISSTPASWRSARAASCCCATLRRATAA